MGTITIPDGVGSGSGKLAKVRVVALPKRTVAAIVEPMTDDWAPPTDFRPLSDDCLDDAINALMFPKDSPSEEHKASPENPSPLHGEHLMNEEMMGVLSKSLLAYNYEMLANKSLSQSSTNKKGSLNKANVDDVVGNLAATKLEGLT